MSFISHSVSAKGFCGDSNQTNKALCYLEWTIQNQLLKYDITRIILKNILCEK
jgi:hypothetical protein